MTPDADARDGGSRCLSTEEILDLVESAATVDATVLHREHIAGCDACRGALESVQFGELVLDLARWSPAEHRLLPTRARAERIDADETLAAEEAARAQDAGELIFSLAAETPPTLAGRVFTHRDASIPGSRSILPRRARADGGWGSGLVAAAAGILALVTHVFGRFDQHGHTGESRDD